MIGGRGGKERGGKEWALDGEGYEDARNTAAKLCHSPQLSDHKRERNTHTHTHRSELQACRRSRSMLLKTAHERHRRRAVTGEVKGRGRKGEKIHIGSELIRMTLCICSG